MKTRKAFVIAGLWAFLVVIAVHFLQFPGSVPDFNRASGGGILLDASPAFTPDGIYGRLAGYGEGGRRNYSLRNVTIDVLLPLSVLPFLLLLSRQALVSGEREPAPTWSHHHRERPRFTAACTCSSRSHAPHIPRTIP
jgi:hypothetical protein